MARFPPILSRIWPRSRHLVRGARTTPARVPGVVAGQARTKAPRVILFIGHHKTGTSTLQDFLSRNALALLRAGILYPSVETQGHALMLAAALRGEDPGQALPINLREAHNALAFRMISEATKQPPPAFHHNLPASAQMLLAIRNQISALGPHTVILCAEVFSNFAVTAPDMIGRLRRAFQDSDITLMATLRRPDEYLVSWEGQRMRFGMTGAPLHSLKRLDSQARTIHLDYRLMLEAWVQAFPAAQIILRNYADVLKNGGSVADFSARCGVRLPGGLTGVPRSNVSMPVALTEIMRQANAALPAAQSSRLRDEIISLAPALSLPLNRDIECFGGGVRACLRQAFAPSADYLQGLTGAPFFPDLDEMLKLRPVPAAEASRAALQQLRPLIAKSDLPDASRQFLADLRIA